MRYLLALILLLPAYSSCSQITVSKPQAQRILDSLNALPLVRREAAAWATAAHGYQRAADSLGRASELNRAAFLAEHESSTTKSTLLDNETAKYERAQAKATRRGVLNGILAAALVAVCYLAITH